MPENIYPLSNWPLPVDICRYRAIDCKRQDRISFKSSVASEHKLLGPEDPTMGQGWGNDASCQKRLSDISEFHIRALSDKWECHTAASQRTIKSNSCLATSFRSENKVGARLT